MKIIDIQIAQKNLNFENKKIQELETELKKKTIIFLNKYDPNFSKVDDRYISVE